jgi:hypothetical protein
MRVRALACMCSVASLTFRVGMTSASAVVSSREMTTGLNDYSCNTAPEPTLMRKIDLVEEIQ